MPKEIFNKGHEFIPQAELLTFEEITRLVNILVPLGLRKIRLTGGEPLIRKDLEILVGMLHTVHPDIELAMTTNGATLAQKAKKLKEHGLDRVTVSLDAIDDQIFKTMIDVDFPVERVIEGIQIADEVGLTPIKINMVVKRGVNEDQILPMAENFQKEGYILRFIEYMDVGSTNRWQLDEVVPAKEIIERIHNVHPVEPLEANYSSEVANRWKYQDGKGEIGLIASVTQPFCGDCTRLRLSAAGELYTCLFGTEGHDIRTYLRGEASDGEISKFITALWKRRKDRYSEIRKEEGSQDTGKVEMSYIGG
jgi:cyclic pyranopterin phosphate synthase